MGGGAGDVKNNFLVKSRRVMAELPGKILPLLHGALVEPDYRQDAVAEIGEFRYTQSATWTPADTETTGKRAKIGV